MAKCKFYAFHFQCFLLQEWEELAKKQPDGTIKRIRRRIVVVKYVKGKPDDDDGATGDEPDDDGKKLKKPEIVEEPEFEEEEVEVDENSPDFDKLFDDPVCIIYFILFPF